MAKEEKIELKGEVVDVLKGDDFKVKLENGHIVNCYPSGKMRMYYIRIIPGDIVDVELSPYDLTQGRIVYRHK